MTQTIVRGKVLVSPQESVNRVVINHYKQVVISNEYTALTLAYVS